MNYLKLIFEPAVLALRVEVLLVTILALFLVVSPEFLVFGDPFAFGEKNRNLALAYPLIGLVFLGLFLNQWGQKKLTLPETNIQIGVSLIALAAVINGYFSLDPAFNLYWLGGLGICSLCLFWKPFQIKADLAMILFLVGLVVGATKALSSVDYISLLAAGWALWFWYFSPLVNPAQQKIMGFLTIIFFISFELYLLAAITVGIATFSWWKQKQKYRRKSFFYWWLGFLGGLVAFGVLLGISFRSFIMPTFETFFGVGIYQAFPVLYETNSAVGTSYDILQSGLSLLWYEWGIASLVLMLGIALTWAKKTNLKGLWCLFIGLLITFPGILSQPYFWLILSFFTFGNTRFLPLKD